MRCVFEVIIDRFSSKSNLNFSSTLGLAVLLSLCLVSLPCFTCAHYKIRLLHPTGFSVTLALKLSKRKQHVGFRTIIPAARLCFAFRFRLPRCLILLNLELVDCEEFLMKICTICVLRHVFVFSPCFITYFSEYSNNRAIFPRKKLWMRGFLLWLASAKASKVTIHKVVWKPYSNNNVNFWQLEKRPETRPETSESEFLVTNKSSWQFLLIWKANFPHRETSFFLNESALM